MNELNLIGYATKKPVYKTKDDKERARFFVGVTTKVAEDKKETLFMECWLFGPRAKFAAQVIDEGSHLFVKGRLSVFSYEKQGMGITRYVLNVSDIQYLDDGTLARLKQITQKNPKEWRF